MKSSSFWQAFALVAPMMAVLSGCARGADEPVNADGSTVIASTTEQGTSVESGQVVDANPVYDLFYEIDALLVEEHDPETDATTFKNLPEATEKFKAALRDEKFAGHEAEVFTVFVRFMLYTGQIEDVETAFLNTVRETPEWARPGFDYIFDYLRNQKKDLEAALEWAEKLLLQPLEDPEKYRANEWRAVLMVNMGKTDELAESLAAVLDGFTGEEAANFVNRIGGECLSQGKFDDLDKILSQVAGSSKKDEPEVVSAMLTMGLISLASKGDWEGVVREFPAAAEKMPDRQARYAFARLVAEARSARKFDALDKLSSDALKNKRFDGVPAIRSIAAREWVNSAMANSKDEALARLAEVNAMNVDPEVVLGLISRHYSSFFEDAEGMKKLIVQSDILASRLTDDADRNALDGVLLDASFVVEDYDRAIKLLETALTDRTPEFRAQTMPKVKAHKALKEGRVDDAVKYFREFMAAIEASDVQSYPDNANDLSYTKEMVLGFNAKRIGKLYEDAGRPDEARKAYAEARDYYGRALTDDKVKATGAAVEVAKKELDSIPR